ncbi:hypothetical protein TNCT_327811 [Trichonephila clavata]|uniref:Uncharacterized protein n=1 Tax=Trichonephila clavata TaxID=2740835 RepID=A0A8X6I196_TRICU|nr:hypothetical protein TNCT_327811 [Trichonephila clavata]
MERFKDLGEHDLENVYYYWMENVHKKWLPLLDGPALSMRQPDDIETREPDDPYTKHTIRCRAVNFHNWVVSTPMSRLLFTHLLNEVTVHDFEDYIHLHETKLHVWFKFYYMKEDDVTFHVCTDCCESSLVEPERTILILDALENLISMMEPELQYNPKLWEDSIQFLNNHWKTKPVPTSDSELLRVLIQTFITVLKRSSSTSLENRWEYYSTRVSVLLGDISQTYLSWETVRSVGNYLSGLKEMGLLSQDNYMDMSKKRRISTSYTTAPIQIDPADANGETIPESEVQLRNLFGAPNSSDNSAGLTGSMLSYISLCQNGWRKKVWIAGRVRRLPGGPESVRWEALRARAENFLERERERIQRDSEPEEPSDVNGKQAVSKRLRGPAETRADLRNSASSHSFF